MKYSNINNQVIMPENTKYLKEAFPNGFLHGFIYNKGITGCGATTCEIETQRNSIIAVPFVSMIENKVAQYPNERYPYPLLGVYDGVDREQIINHLKRNEVGKIICTYDAIPRLMNICKDEFFLLIDEYHILYHQYHFRYKAFRDLLKTFQRFNKWAFVSATPVLTGEYIYDDLKDIPVNTLVWKQKKALSIELITAKNPVNQTARIIDSYMAGKMQNAHIFINSVSTISDLAVMCNLSNENCKAVWSKNNEQKMCGEIERGEALTAPKKINLYTSTAFEGCDIYDEEGEIYVVSDARLDHTLLDVSTSLPQIAGRIRNSKYADKITHIVSNGKKNSNYDEYKDVVRMQIDEYKTIMEDWNGLEREISRKAIGIGGDLKKYIYTDNSNSRFYFDENTVKSELFQYKISNQYNSIETLISEYGKKGFVVNTTEERTSDIILNKWNRRTHFEDAYTEYSSLKDSLSQEKEVPAEVNEKLKAIESKYPYMNDVYITLGNEEVKRLKYNTTNIKRAIYNIKTKESLKSKHEKVIALMSLNDGEYYAAATLHKKLVSAYEYLGIQETPKPGEIKEYYNVIDKVRRENGEQARGYMIIKPKIIQGVA